MEKKIEIAERRFEEMGSRKSEFLKRYAETNDPLQLELANVEAESMEKLALAIMKVKRGN